ncbi:hypothetical protein A258_22358, partial [Pseudomonas syringae pv. actinidiae ICMP 19104]
WATLAMKSWEIIAKVYLEFLHTLVRMRPDQLLMDAPHLHSKFPGRGFAQGSGLVQGLGVEIDVGVVAVDVLH